jgi:hypothetical protein
MPDLCIVKHTRKSLDLAVGAGGGKDQKGSIVAFLLVSTTERKPVAART